MLSTLWNNIIFLPFLNLMMVFYHVFGNSFGMAVIVMAVITRLLMVPATKSQMEMTKKMASMRPELAKIQKKYASNPQKLSEEQMKLYKKVGYNPVGCLGSFLPQMIILYAIINIINVISSNHFEGLYPAIRDFVFSGVANPIINTNFFGLDLSKNYQTIASQSGYFAVEGIVYFALAALVAYIQFLSTKFMQSMQGTPAPVKKSKKDEQMSPEEMQAQMMGSMNSIFPLMTGIFTLTVPAVLGVYWLAQSVMMIVQYFFIDKEKSVKALRSLFAKK